MNLTPAQQRAVTTESTDVLCLAGAGSGKTRVLVERCVHLIRDRGRSPSEIMVLTFTRKAAGEVRDRLQKRLEEFWGRKTTAELRPMLIGTFHAVSLSIVRSHLELLGYQNEVSVITENDSVKVLGQVCVDLGYRIGDNYRIGLSFDQISRAIGSYYSSGRFPVFRENRQMEACIRIMREYHARLRSMSALDFGLILAEAKRLLDEFVAPRNEWQHRIRAVLVDEIQDTDEVQFDLHARFCPPAEFFGVGDRRQCAPPGSMVETPSGRVPIEDLKDGDHVLTFSRRSQIVLGRQVPFRIKVSSRHFRGTIITITAGARSTSCTPNHRWWVKWVKNDRKITVVYLMRKGVRWRVGWCQLFDKHGGFHLARRAAIERADAVWILQPAIDRTRASVIESLVSTQYGLPTMPFWPVNGANHITKEAIDLFFNSLDQGQQEQRARCCLGMFGLTEEDPIWDSSAQKKRGRSTCMEVTASNLVPNLMMVPVPFGNKRSRWLSITSKKHERYEGPVYSLDVEKHHTYIQDGMITCNSIYRFRGARPDLMTERHPNAEIIDLQENFRSGRRVVEAANRLIHHNGDMLAAPMSCSTGREGNVQVITGRSDDLARMANALLVRYQPQEMAVMARSHRLLRRLESVFRDAGIPVHRVGAAFDVCESDSFLSLLAAMRLMTNPRDNLAFASLRDDLKVGSRAYADLRAHADLKGCSHFFAYLDSVPKSSGLDSMLRDQSVGQMNADVFADLFCSATLRKRDMSVTFWREIAPKMDVKTAVLWYGTRDSQDDLGPGDRVMLLTAHAAKGLEWPVVVVANMNEGVFPSKQALKDLDGDREERRLAYVAMTRARESLILHYRRPEDQSGPNFQPASRFIREAIGDADGSQDDKGVRSLRGNPQRGVLPSDCQEGRGAAQPGSVGGDRPGSGSLPEGAGAGSEVHRPGSFAAGQGEQQ